MRTCPAEFFGVDCPMAEEVPNCGMHMDRQGRLIECWVVVQHLLQLSNR